MNPAKRFASARASASVWLVRARVGLVFLTEGIAKFLYPDVPGLLFLLIVGARLPTLSSINRRRLEKQIPGSLPGRAQAVKSLRSRTAIGDRPGGNL
jgi:hypothetical protein